MRPVLRSALTTVLVLVASALVLVPGGAAVAAPPTTACDTQAVDDGLVPVLQLQVPTSASWFGQTPAYSYDDTAAVAGGFDRIGYCLETASDVGQRWVWSAMEPFTSDASRLGLPTRAGQVVRQRVDDLTVASNVPSVRTGAGQTGYLEMWPYSYHMPTSRQVGGASGAAYDADDRPATGGGYGSFQVHSVGARQSSTTSPQTVLAVNHFTDASPGQVDVGVGPAPTGEPDWTFAGNAGTFGARTLTVYARPSTVALTAAPTDRRLYPRDASGGAVARVAGTVTDPAVDSVRLTVAGSDGTPVVAEQDGPAFAFTPRLEAGLHSYDLRLETVTDGATRTVAHWTDLVSGDAYFVEGQSNAQADMYTPGATTVESPFIRSFGTNAPDQALSAADRAWNFAGGDLSWDTSSIGQWAMSMADELMRSEQVPIAVVNGAHNGARVGFLQRNDAAPDDIATNYGRARQRLVAAGLMGGLSGVFYYQGESENEDADVHVAGVRELLADWRADLGGARGEQPPYYLFQVRTSGCGGVGGVALREAQRRLGETDGVTVLSTNGLPGHDGCHYSWAGYQALGRQVADTVRRDVFGGPSDGVAAPNPVSAELATSEGREIVVQLASTTDDLEVDAGIGPDFRLLGSDARVTGVRYDGRGRLALTLSRPAPETTGVSYYGHLGDGPMITTSRGVGLLAFGSLPVEDPSDHDRALRTVLDDLRDLDDTAADLLAAGDLTPDQADRVAGSSDAATARVEAALAVVRGGSGDEAAELLAAVAEVDELAAWLEGGELTQPVLGQLRGLVARADRHLDGVTATALGISATLVQQEAPVLAGEQLAGTVRVTTATRDLRDVSARVSLEGWEVDDSGAAVTAAAAGVGADLPFTATVPDTQQPGAVTPRIEVTMTTDVGTFVVPVATQWVDVSSQVTLGSVSAAAATGGPGGRVLVTADVVNGSGGPLTGRLVVSGPSGWPTQAAGARVTVAPGERLAATVPVTVPIDVVSGAYPVTVSLRRAGVELGTAPLTLSVARTTPPAAGVTDHVDFGDGASETAHGVQASATSGTNVEAGLTRRYSFATPGAWFSARVEVPIGRAFVLRGIETFAGARTKRYDVLVDGTLVRRMDFTRTEGGQGALSHDVLVDDPAVLAHDGTVTVRYQFPADAGGATDPSIADLWVIDLGSDTIDPDVSATVAGARPGLAGWQRGPVTVTVDAIDDRDRSPRVETGTADGAGWQAYAGPLSIAGEGRRTISVRVTDDAGNRSAEDVAVWIDSTAPATSIAVRSQSGRAVVDLTATDALSGLARTSYRLDGGAWAVSDGDAFAVTGAGGHVVEYRSVDVAGNRERVRRTEVEVHAVESPTVVAPPTVGATAPVPKASSRTRLAVDRRKVRAGRKVAVRTRVTATGATAEGTVRVLVDGRVVRTLTLTDQRATVRVKVRRGKHRVRVRYLGSDSVEASSSRVVVLRGR